MLITVTKIAKRYSKLVSIWWNLFHLVKFYRRNECEPHKNMFETPELKRAVKFQVQRCLHIFLFLLTISFNFHLLINHYYFSITYIYLSLTFLIFNLSFFALSLFTLCLIHVRGYSNSAWHFLALFWTFIC